MSITLNHRNTPGLLFSNIREHRLSQTLGDPSGNHPFSSLQNEN